MCVAFNPEVVYKNAFYSNDGQKLASRLKKIDIAKFCQFIEDEIVKKSKINIKYEYVYFDFNKNTVSIFFDANFGIFTESKDEVFLNTPLDPDEINEMNGMYDKAVRNSMAKAKQRFQELITSTN